jgi:hypothetical protein
MTRTTATATALTTTHLSDRRYGDDAARCSSMRYRGVLLRLAIVCLSVCLFACVSRVARSRKRHGVATTIMIMTIMFMTTRRTRRRTMTTTRQ